MPREKYNVDIAATCHEVFELLHNYDIRLEWDSMLSEARLLDGAETAGIGVRSLCVGTWRGLFLGLETEYVSFSPGKVAAVTLTNQPPFLDHFAATIKHEPLDNGRCRTTYIYFFRAKPHFLAPILEPLINVMLKREVRNRLHSLRRYFENRPK